MMAACVVTKEESLDSLGQEEVFLAETAQFAGSVIKIYHQKQSKKLISQGLETKPKGLTQSRVQSSVVVPLSASVGASVSEEQIDQTTATAEKLIQIAEKHKEVLDDLYDGYISSGHTVWDINSNYNDFKGICTSVLRAAANALANRKEQILLVLANCCYVCEELNNAGGDTHRQNQFVNHVGRYLVEHGFQPWIREQGGWDKMMGSSVDTIAAPIDLSEDTPV